MSESLVSTSAVSKRYGDVVALDRVDLAVPQGSVYGLIGPNGAGKTTMLGILAGLRKATAGSVEVETASVGVLPDTPQFDRWLTGREVVDLSRCLVDDARPESKVDEVLEVAGLTADAHRQVRGYSRGMLQRLGLASVVVNEPDLLLLDEPAAALDPGGRREVLDLISALRGTSTVLFSSHILDDVQEVCDEIGILTRGEMGYQGSLDGLLSRYVGTRYLVRIRHGHDDIIRVLEAEQWVKSVSIGTNRDIAIEITSQSEAERRLVGLLARSELPVVSVVPDRTSLEQVFLEVTR